MKRVKRYLVVMIALGLIVTFAMIIPASAQTSKGDVKVDSNEFIFSTMDYAGNITGIQIYNWLSLNGDGTVEVKEVKTLDGDTSYKGVRGFTKPTVEGDMIVWPSMSVDGPTSVIASTELSESMVDEAKMKIPLGVRFRYWFDGEPITDPGSITGKTGRFKMEITFKNESRELTEVEYEDPTTGEMTTTEVETYLPIGIQPYDWNFDNSIFYNLEADPTGLIVQFPDMYSVGWTIPLFPPATNESHTIWVAADVKNFQLPPLTLGVAFVFPESNQVDPFVFIKPGMEQIYDGVKQLSEGIGNPETEDTLLYGITAVNDGLQEMGAGLPEAVSSINSDMIPGVNQMIAGIGSPTTADTLLYADTAATSGLFDIKAGIGSATTQDTLLYAAAAIGAGLNQMNAGIGSITAPGTLLNGLESMKEGLEETLAGIGSATTPNTLLYAMNSIVVGLAGIYAGLDPAAGIPVILSTTASELSSGGNLYALVNGAMPEPQRTQALGIMNILVNGGSFPPPFPGLLYGVAQLAAIRAGIGDGSPGNTLAYAANAVTAGLNEIAAGIGSATTPDTLLYGVAAVTGGLLQFQAGIGSATTPDTLLYAVAAMEAGLNDMKTGIGDTAVPDTLLYALAGIQTGLYQIQGGLSTGNLSDPGIKEGLVLISAGLGDAVTGIGSASTPDTLLYGTNAVEGGLTDAGEGATALENGLAGFVEAFAESDAQLAAIAQRGEEFDHLLGRAEDAKDSVRFVYQMKPTYNYKSGSTTSWIVAIVLSIIIALVLAAGGILLARRGSGKA